MTASGRHGLARLAAVLLSTALFVVCAYDVAVRFAWGQIWPIVKAVDMRWLLVGGAVGICLYWGARTLRWYVLLRRLGVQVDLFDLYLCTAISLTLSLYTPMQSGEALKVELLRKLAGVQRFEGYSSFAAERVADLLVVAAVACVSVFFKLNILADRRYGYVGVAAIAVASAAAAVVVLRWHPKGKAGEFFRCFRECASKPWTVTALMGLTLTGWVLVALTWQVILRSASLRLALADTMSLMAVVTLISVISLIPGALGVAEVGTAGLLVRFGYTALQAQSGAIVLRAYGLIAWGLAAVHMAAWLLLRVARRRASCGRACPAAGSGSDTAE